MFWWGNWKFDSIWKQRGVLQFFRSFIHSFSQWIHPSIASLCGTNGWVNISNWHQKTIELQITLDLNCVGCFWNSHSIKCWGSSNFCFSMRMWFPVGYQGTYSGSAVNHQTTNYPTRSATVSIHTTWMGGITQLEIFS